MKTLYRKTRGAKLAGVCEGLGEHFDVDPNLVRLIAVGSCLLSGAGVWMYVAAWLLLPEKPPQLIARPAPVADE